MNKSTEPLRGEAAWKAAKKSVADRNEAAYARGRRDRAARAVVQATRRRDEERESNKSLPQRPAR
jgi:hypothetical protein